MVGTRHGASELNAVAIKVKVNVKVKVKVGMSGAGKGKRLLIDNKGSEDNSKLNRADRPPRG